MNKPQEVMHSVTIQSISMLAQILAQDNYRAGTKWPNQQRHKGPLPELPVNSVHWAHSTFPLESPVVVSASDGETTEAFEDPTLHFCIGIQWHPEYAQKGLDGRPEEIERQMHARTLQALGHAAEDSRAARVLQRAVRQFLHTKRNEKK